MNSKRKAVIASREISEFRTYSLGGYDQKVLIEGKYKTNPILIFLHGGPGCPIPFCEGDRGMNAEITDRFLMVYWDQLGCGINHYKIDDSFSINNFVDMTVDLIMQIKKDFPENTISIFGVSWGSVLAAKAAQRVPQLLYRVMIYGHVLKQLAFNEEVYATLESCNLTSKTRQQLEIIKNADKHTLKELKLIVRWIQKYTEGYFAKDGGKNQIGRMICGLFTSPDYSLNDIKAVLINSYLMNKSLLTELLEIDLSDVLHNIQVPYLILQGDKDIVTSTKMISTFTETTTNKNITFHCIQNSAHMPSNTGMDYITKEGFDFLDSRIVN